MNGTEIYQTFVKEENKENNNNAIFNHNRKINDNENICGLKREKNHGFNTHSARENYAIV